MYVGTKQIFEKYDQALLEQGNRIEELVDLASDALYRHLDQYQSYAFLIGPGNNGADGLSLGLKLALNKKEVQFYCFSSHLSPANSHYLEQVLQLSIPVAKLDQGDLESFQEELNLYDVVVDCLFGFGLNKPLEGIYQDVAQMVNNGCNSFVVAIDIPSGMYCDSFNDGDTIIKADMTVTLTALKQSFLNPASQDYTGKIALEYLDAPSFHEQLGFARILERNDMVRVMKKRNYDDYKHRNGMVIHFTGSSRYRGAGVLAAKAAVYSGSGIVALSSVAQVEQAVCNHVPEVVFDFLDGTSMEQGLAKYDAILVGSGLGISLESIKTVFGVLEYARVPVVVDGDALTILAKRQEILKDIPAKLVLTPHIGEFKRFCQIEDGDDVMAKAVSFARENRVILVLKGPNTIITDGKGTYRNSTGSMAMATAGSGDVLAGMISSFLAQGYDPLKAACLGVYCHGQAGEEVGATSYMAVASQVIEKIPEVLKDFEGCNLKYSR